MHERSQTQVAHRTVVNVTRKTARDSMKDAARGASMTLRIKQLVLLLFLVAALVAAQVAAQAAAVPSQVKAAAPIPQIGYMELFKTIGQAQGQVVVVYFFASWCPACKKVAPRLITARQEYSGEDLMLIGVSVDENPKELSSYAKKTGFNFPIFQATQEVANIFQIESLPKTLIYNKKGRLAHNSDGEFSLEEFHQTLDGLLQQ